MALKMFDGSVSVVKRSHNDDCLLFRPVVLHLINQHSLLEAFDLLFQLIKAHCEDLGRSGGLLPLLTEGVSYRVNFYLILPCCLRLVSRTHGRHGGHL